MTRINLGIKPAELCDQMLVAEYRELPRMYAFAERRWTKYKGFCGPRPKHFKLNTGHMAYFLPYGGTLLVRWLHLCAEMKRRGFKINLLSWRSLRWEGFIADSAEVRYARQLLTSRIQERLAEMKRTPTWTNRVAPKWAFP